MEDIATGEQLPGARLHGGLIREIVRWHRAGPEPRSLGISAYRIEPGQRCTVHVHEGKVETWYIVSGTAEVLWGDETFFVGPGSAVRTPPGKPHGMRALDGAPVSFLNIVEYIDGAEVVTTELEDEA